MSVSTAYKALFGEDLDVNQQATPYTPSSGISTLTTPATTTPTPFSPDVDESAVDPNDKEYWMNKLASDIGVPAEWVDRLVTNESGWNPMARSPNKRVGAKGIIQFTNNTAKGLGYADSEDLIQKNPTIKDQVEGPVRDYFAQIGRPITNESDFYLSVFHPAAMGSSDDTVLPENVRKENPQYYTVGDFVTKYKNTDTSGKSYYQPTQPIGQQDPDSYWLDYGEKAGLFSTEAIQPPKESTPMSIAEKAEAGATVGFKGGIKGLVETAALGAKMAPRIATVLPGIGGVAKMMSSAADIVTKYATKGQEKSAFKAWDKAVNSTLDKAEGYMEVTPEQQAEMKAAGVTGEIASFVTSTAVTLPAMIVAGGGGGVAAKGILNAAKLRYGEAALQKALPTLAKMLGPKFVPFLEESLGMSIGFGALGGVEGAAEAQAQGKGIKETIATAGERAAEGVVSGPLFATGGLAGGVVGKTVGKIGEALGHAIGVGAAAGTQATVTPVLEGEKFDIKEFLKSGAGMALVSGAFKIPAIKKAATDWASNNRDIKRKDAFLKTLDQETRDASPAVRKQASDLMAMVDNGMDKLTNIPGPKLIRNQMEKFDADPNGSIEVPYGRSGGEEFAVFIKDKDGKNKAVVFDLDSFGYVNNTGGHVAGDVALTNTGKLLHEYFKDPEKNTEERVVEFLKDFPNKVQHTIGDFKGEPVTISAGIANTTKMADIMAYESKHGGKNRLTIYNGADSPVTTILGKEVEQPSYIRKGMKLKGDELEKARQDRVTYLQKNIQKLELIHNERPLNETEITKLDNYKKEYAETPEAAEENLIRQPEEHEPTSEDVAQSHLAISADVLSRDPYVGRHDSSTRVNITFKPEDANAILSLREQSAKEEGELHSYHVRKRLMEEAPRLFDEKHFDEKNAVPGQPKRELDILSHESPVHIKEIPETMRAEVQTLREQSAVLENADLGPKNARLLVDASRYAEDKNKLKLRQEMEEKFPTNNVKYRDFWNYINGLRGTQAIGKKNKVTIPQEMADFAAARGKEYYETTEGATEKTRLEVLGVKPAIDGDHIIETYIGEGPRTIKELRETYPNGPRLERILKNKENSMRDPFEGVEETPETWTDVVKLDKEDAKNKKVPPKEDKPTPEEGGPTPESFKGPATAENPDPAGIMGGFSRKGPGGPDIPPSVPAPNVPPVTPVKSGEKPLFSSIPAVEQFFRGFTTPKYAGSLNLDKADQQHTADLHQLIIEQTARNKAQIQDVRGKVVPQNETARLSQLLGVKEGAVRAKFGDALKSEHLRAMNDILESTTMDFKKLADELEVKKQNGTLTNNDIVDFTAAQQFHGWILAKTMSHNAEAGRALNILNMTREAMRGATSIKEAMAMYEKFKSGKQGELSPDIIGKIKERESTPITPEEHQDILKEIGVSLTPEQLAKLRERVGGKWNHVEQQKMLKEMGASLSEEQLAKLRETRVEDKGWNADPQKMLQEIGVSLTPEQLEAYRNKLVERSVGGKAEQQTLIDAITGENRKSIEEMISAVSKVDLSKPDAFKKINNNPMYKKLLDGLYEYWMNLGLLSAPITHTANLTSNVATAIMRTVEKGAAPIADILGSAIDRSKGRSMINRANEIMQRANEGRATKEEVTKAKNLMYEGNKLASMKQERFFGEAVYDALGKLGGLKDTWDAAWKNYDPKKGGVDLVAAAKALGKAITEKSPGTSLGKMDVPPKPIIPGKIGAVVRAAGNLMRLEDDLVKGPVYKGAISSLAYRMAKTEGLKGKELKNRIDDIVAQATEKNALFLDPRIEKMKEEAYHEAHYQTFTQSLGKIGNAVMHLRGVTPVSRWVVPFIRTVTNLTKYGLERLPITGEAVLLKKFLAKEQTGHELSDQIGKIIVGHMLSLPVLMLAGQGKITGAGPHQDAERKLWEAEGKKPYSMKIGDNWYSYQRLEPLATVMGTLADFHEIWNSTGDQTKTVGEKFATGIWAISQNITNKTFMQGVSDAMNAIMEPSRYGKKYITRFGTSFIPSVVRSAAGGIDETQRQATTTGEIFMSKIPGLAQQLPEKKNIFGKTVYREGGVGPVSRTIINLFSPIQVTSAKNDPVVKEMERLEVFKTLPKRDIIVGGEKVNLSRQEYNRFLEESGQQAYLEVRQYMRSNKFRSDDDDEKASKISNLMDRVRQKVRDKIKKKYKPTTKR